MPEPRPSPRQIVERLREGLGDAFEYAFVDHERVICRVKKDGWVDAVRFVRTDPLLGCTFFSWLSAIDWTEAEVVDAEAAGEEGAEGDEARSVGGDTSASPATDEAGAGTETQAETGSGQEPEGQEEAESPPEARQPDVDPSGIAAYSQPSGELFEVCCHLSAPEREFGVTLKTALEKDSPVLETLTTTVRGADWHERECHEMFGITFEGHPNLAPLYLPEEFEGHPLLKSYALGARLVKPWPGIVDVEEIPPDLEPRLDALAAGESPSPKDNSGETSS